MGQAPERRRSPGAGGSPLPRRLTKKQRALARAKILNPDATLRELGEHSGYTKRSHVKRALDAPHVQQRIRDLMDASPRLRDEALLRKLEDGLDARETKFFAHEGRVKDKREVVDHGTRHRYLETALALKGHKKIVDVTSGGETIKALLLEDGE